MKSRTLIDGVIIAACGLMFAISLGYGALVGFVLGSIGAGGDWAQSTSLLATIGAPPLGLLLAICSLSKRPALSGAILVVAIMISFTGAATMRSGVGGELLMAELIWIPSGLLGLTMMLLGLAPDQRHHGRITPEHEGVNSH